MFLVGAPMILIGVPMVLVGSPMVLVGVPMVLIGSPIVLVGVSIFERVSSKLCKLKKSNINDMQNACSHSIYTQYCHADEGSISAILFDKVIFFYLDCLFSMCDEVGRLRRAGETSPSWDNKKIGMTAGAIFNEKSKTSAPK